MNASWAIFDWGDTLMVDFGHPGPMKDWPEVRAVEYAYEALTALRTAGWHVAVATNANDSTEADVFEALGRVGLAELVDRAFTSHDVGHRKPTPEFWDGVLGALGVSASEAVMIGDNPGVDVEGANRLGMRAVWLRQPERTLASDPLRATIDDLWQLPATLEAW